MTVAFELSPSWPTPPWAHVTTWQNPDAGRFKLPPGAPETPCYGVDTVGPGWLEASLHHKAPHLPAVLRLQTDRRLALDEDAKGIARRFGALPGDRILVTVSPIRKGFYLRIVAMDCVEFALRDPVLRPASLLHNDGYLDWYRRVVEKG